jgi:hypothetical protein
MSYVVIHPDEWDKARTPVQILNGSESGDDAIEHPQQRLDIVWL